MQQIYQKVIISILDKWSVKAKECYPNNRQACVSFWNKMKCTEHGAPKYKHNLLIGVAICYYTDSYIDCYLNPASAPRGSGKTFQIKKCLQTQANKRVLVLSPRQTFSKEKHNEFKEMCPDS